MNKFEEIEKRYKRKHKIIIENYTHDNNISLEDFIVNYFHDLNHKLKTIYKTSGKTQCSTNRRRSLGDMYMICKSYYPNVTIEEVVKILNKKNAIGSLSCNWCPNVKKRVFKAIFLCKDGIPNCNGSMRYKLTLPLTVDENGLSDEDYDKLEK